MKWNPPATPVSSAFSQPRPASSCGDLHAPPPRIGTRQGSRGGSDEKNRDVHTRDRAPRPRRGSGAGEQADEDQVGGRKRERFWYTTEWLSETSYRSTVWYVGVYQSGEDTFSDLYFDSSICQVTPPEDTCTFESSRYGFSDLSGQTFTIDAKSLTSAHLDAVYDLQAYDADFNPVGDPVATHIVTDWTGLGSLSREKSSYSVHTPCGVIRYTSKGVSQAAEATGSLDGTDLGETNDGYLATGTSRSFEPTC